MSDVFDEMKSRICFKKDCPNNIRGYCFAGKFCGDRTEKEIVYMNMVVIKHPNDSGKYIFRVPEGIELDAGTLVVCDTNRGNQPGVCATGTFRADPIVICPMWGTQPRMMKRIVKVLHESILEWPDEPEAVPEDDD